MGPTEESVDVASVIAPSVSLIVGTNRTVGKTRERLSLLSATTIRFAKPSLPWNPRRSAPPGYSLVGLLKNDVFLELPNRSSPYTV